MWVSQLRRWWNGSSSEEPPAAAIVVIGEESAVVVALPHSDTDIHPATIPLTVGGAGRPGRRHNSFMVSCITRMPSMKLPSI